MLNINIICKAYFSRVNVYYTRLKTSIKAKQIWSPYDHKQWQLYCASKLSRNRIFNVKFYLIFVLKYLKFKIISNDLFQILPRMPFKLNYIPSFLLVEIAIIKKIDVRTFFYWCNDFKSILTVKGIINYRMTFTRGNFRSDLQTQPNNIKASYY